MMRLHENFILHAYNYMDDIHIIMKMFGKIVSHSFITHGAVSILANELS
jgi:hypothetical protein